MTSWTYSTWSWSTFPGGKRILCRQSGSSSSDLHTSPAPYPGGRQILTKISYTVSEWVSKSGRGLRTSPAPYPGGRQILTENSYTVSEWVSE